MRSQFVREICKQYMKLSEKLTVKCCCCIGVFAYIRAYPRVQLGVFPLMSTVYVLARISTQRSAQIRDMKYMLW